MSTAQINLTSLLNILRHTHNTLTVAVLSTQDATFYKHHRGDADQLPLIELEDGRTALFTIEEPEKLERHLQLRAMIPESWVRLCVFDDKYDEVVYVTNIDGRYVRVQTGMLDEYFGFVVVQSVNRGDDGAQFIEDRDLLSPAEFDAKYERLAVAPVSVYQPMM